MHFGPLSPALPVPGGHLAPISPCRHEPICHGLLDLSRIPLWGDPENIVWREEAWVERAGAGLASECKRREQCNSWRHKRSGDCGDQREQADDRGVEPWRPMAKIGRPAVRTGYSRRLCHHAKEVPRVASAFFTLGRVRMTEKNVDQLLTELRQLLQTEYERGGQDALRRILSAVKQHPDRKLREMPAPAGKSIRGGSRAARLQ